jgi:PKD repeat protein
MARAAQDPCRFEMVEPRCMLDAADPTVDFAAGFVAAEMALNGAASVVDGELAVTPATSGSAGSAYYRTKVSVDQFVTRFVYDPSPVGSSPGGGATFVIQNQSATALGGTGDSFGYKTMEPSMALAFVVSSNNLHLYTDSSSANLTNAKYEPLSAEVGDFNAGHPFEVILSYDGSKLEIILTNQDTGNSFYQNHDIGIPTLVGGNTAWVGFTGGSSWSTQDRIAQEIETWTYYAGTDEIPAIPQFTINGLSPHQSLAGNVIRAQTPYDAEFDASDSIDVDGSIASYHWDFGDGDQVTTSSATISHQYDTAGQYIAAVTVTDDDGNDSLARSINIVVDDALDAVVQASRTSGAGPLNVHFDATRTTGLAQGDLINARFAWDFDVTDVDPEGRYEHGEGFVAAHVYEAPGTYTTRLTVTDAEGNTSIEDTVITVSDVDETWTTYYVASDGDDSDPGTIAEPFQNPEHAFDLAGPKVRILLKKGDTWVIDTRLEAGATGPVIVDAYEDPSDPSDDAPVIHADYANTNDVIKIWGEDWRVMNLEMGALPAGDVTKVRGMQLTGTHVLVSDIEFGLIGAVASIVSGQYLTMLDCTAVADEMGPLFVYGAGARGLALIGNEAQVDWPSQKEHVIRIQSGYQTYLAHNALRAKTGKTNTQIRGANSLVVLYDNEFMGRTSGLQPQNDYREEYVHHVLVEGNRFINEPTYDGVTYGSPVGVTARHVAIRNNLSINHDHLASLGSSHSWVGGAHDVHLYNNTAYANDERWAITGQTDYGLLFRATGSGDYRDLVVRNNLVYSEATHTPNFWMTAIRISSVAAPELTCDHNIFYGQAWGETNCFSVDDSGKTLAQWQALGFGSGSLYANPQVISTDVTHPDFMKLSPTSPAIDVGALDVPVFGDRDNVTRPQGSAPDMGAYEVPVARVPGDANGDGTVTDADYTIWADNYGATGASFDMGDFNGDGAVTDADYTLWADHYGQNAAAPAYAVEAQAVTVVKGIMGPLPADAITQPWDVQEPLDLLSILDRPAP